MSVPPDPRLRAHLEYIVETIANIRELTSDGRASVEHTPHKLPALLYYLHTLAESTSHIPETIKQKYPQIPWSLIIGFRNRLVHRYLSLDMDIVWNVVETQLEPLAVSAQAILQELFSA